MSLLYIFLIQIALSKMLSCCGLNDLHKSYREAKRQRTNVRVNNPDRSGQTAALR